MLINWKLPAVALGITAIVLTVPAWRFSCPAVLEIIGVPVLFVIVNAFVPDATVLNVVGVPNAMLLAVGVPVVLAPVNTLNVFAVVPVPGARFTKRTAA